MIFGIQIAIQGGMISLLANVNDNLERNIKTTPNIIATAKCNPKPPLTFLLAMLAPIIVKINVVNGSANLLCFSTSNNRVMPDPLFTLPIYKGN